MKRFVIVLVVLIVLSRVIVFEQGNPISEDGVSVWVVDHGYHAGLVLRYSDAVGVSQSTGQAILTQFPEADWVEFGWGDAGFYSEVPTLADLTAGVVLNALLLPSRSVMHVATGKGPASTAFPYSDIYELRLSKDAFAKLLVSIEEGFADTASLGVGLYGDSGFYQGQGSYHLFQTCNSWISQRLRAAGIASSPGLSIVSAGLLADLRLRY